jgi:hypothetical protein
VLLPGTIITGITIGIIQFGLVNIVVDAIVEYLGNDVHIGQISNKAKIFLQAKFGLKLRLPR